MRLKEREKLSRDYTASIYRAHKKKIGEDERKGEGGEEREGERERERVCVCKKENCMKLRGRDYIKKRERENGECVRG